ANCFGRQGGTGRPDRSLRSRSKRCELGWFAQHRRTSHAFSAVSSAGCPITSAKLCSAGEKATPGSTAGMTPADFCSVGKWYKDFAQNTDDEVRALAGRSEQECLAA